MIVGVHGQVAGNCRDCVHVRRTRRHRVLVAEHHSRLGRTLTLRVLRCCVGLQGICGRGRLNCRQGRSQRLVAVVGRAESASIAGAVDAAQSASRRASECLTVAGVAVDCVGDGGYCWCFAPIAWVIFSFLWAARNDTAAVVVARMYWSRKRQLIIPAAAR